VIHALLLTLALAAPDANLKRARDRFEFGAWADAAGSVRAWLAEHPEPSGPEAIDAFRMLGIAEFHLGNVAQSREAFVALLSQDPDYTLDPFLVPPPVVEFFDRVRKENEPALVPLRERKRALAEQQRLADEARRRLIAEEQARSGPPTKIIRVEQRHYAFNWMPFGAGQFQNGHKAKGTALAAAQLALGATNLAAILIHNQIADDRSRRCSPSQQTGCSRPPYTDSDRDLLRRVDIVKYASAALFWSVYGFGVYDAHRFYVPRVETDITPTRGAIRLSWRF
jgi:hypothetical protein